MNKMNVSLQRSIWYFADDVFSFVLNSFCLTTSLFVACVMASKSFGEMVILPFTRNPVGGRISAKEFQLPWGSPVPCRPGSAPPILHPDLDSGSETHEMVWLKRERWVSLGKGMVEGNMAR